MHKWLVIISSLSLIGYSLFSLYLPMIVEDATTISVDHSILADVEANLDTADTDTLRSLTKIMLEDIKSEQYKNTEVLDATIEFYSAFDFILLWLLLIHFVLVFIFVYKSKPNKKYKKIS
ncbi:hypothetical protein [Pseudoalteromonas sp. GB56]